MKVDHVKIKTNLNFTIEELENRLETVQVVVDGGDPDCATCGSCSSFTSCSCACDVINPPPNCPMGFEVSTLDGGTIPMGTTY